MRQVKVLHLITRLVVGGSQDNTLITVKKHDRDRFVVHLASNPDGSWCDRALQATDYFHPLNHLVNPINPLQDWQALLEIVQLLKKEKVDIIHTHSSKAGFLGRFAGRIAKTPRIIHTIHGFSFHDFMPRVKKEFYINLEKAARPCTDYFITLSERDRHEAAELGILGLENSQTVYTGIDFTKLDIPSNPEETRKQLGIPPGWRSIVMVGRLDPQKAPYLLIEAFAEVVKQHPETILLLVGDGELRPSLEELVKKLDLVERVKFLGSREDVPDILKAADIFSFSSLWEAMGRAMIEATLVGKPVVVPILGGIPEIIKHQETGLLFPPGDIQQLATHLIYLLNHPEEGLRLGKNAQNLTRKLFDGDNMVRQIEEIYERLLKQKLEK